MSAPRCSQLLQKFLADSGWPAPRDSQVAQRMHEALAFFHQHLPGWIDLPLDQSDRGYQVHGFGPFAYKIGGKVTKLTSAMQGIDFDHPVVPRILKKDRVLRRFGGASDQLGAPAPGIWYTEKNVPASLLALPPGQTTAFDYVVIVRAPMLVSTAGDMYVDWDMKPRLPGKPTLGVDYHYRHGGGVQYVIPNASQFLRPLID